MGFVTRGIVVAAGRAITKMSIGSLFGNIATTAIKKEMITLTRNKAVDCVMTGTGAFILGAMVTDMATNYVENQINDTFDTIDDMKEFWKEVAKKGDTNGQQISEQQQVSGAAEGGEPGGETSGEKEA